MDRLVAMKVFVEVVDAGSLSSAARRLDMSRAMASRYLAELEQWAGARLLHRTTRKLSLTTAGTEALPRCRQALTLADEIRSAVAAPEDGPRGLLRITASVWLGQTFLSRAVTDYVARYPGTLIDLMLVNHSVNLVEERIDLAVRITNNLDPNVIARRLGSIRSVVCASPDYVRRHGTPQRAEDLALHNCLTYTYFGKSLWQFRHRGGEPISVPVGGNISANESNALLTAALAGAGITMQPMYPTLQLIRSGRLVALLPDYEPDELGIHAVYTSRKQMSSALRTMIDFLAERFASGLAWETAALA